MFQLMKGVNSETSDWQRKWRFSEEEGLWFYHLISKNEQEPHMSNSASKPKTDQRCVHPIVLSEATCKSYICTQRVEQQQIFRQAE